MLTPGRRTPLLASALLVTLAACGGGASSGSSAPAATFTPAPSGTAATPQAGQGSQGPTAARVPGATGLLADISGTRLQLQSTDTQTAVTYRASTTFTSTVVASSADAKVGMCANARSAVRSTATPAPSASADPSAASMLAATTIVLSSPVNGSCNVGAGGGAPPAAPSARPSGPPSGFPGGRGGFGGFASGTITAVTAKGLVVEGRRLGGATGSDATRTTTVTTTSSTLWQRTVAAKASSLKLGTCVTAVGETGADGTVAATSIASRPAEADGTCSAGPGGRGPGAAVGGPAA